MPDGADWLRLVTPDTNRVGQSSGRPWPPRCMASLGLINPISKSRIVNFYLCVILQKLVKQQSCCFPSDQYTRRTSLTVHWLDLEYQQTGRSAPSVSSCMHTYSDKHPIQLELCIMTRSCTRPLICFYSACYAITKQSVIMAYTYLDDKTNFI